MALFFPTSLLFIAYFPSDVSSIYLAVHAYFYFYFPIAGFIR